MLPIDTEVEPLAELIGSGREKAITADQAVKHPAFRRNDRPPHKSLIYRLMNRGTHGIVLANCWSAGQRVTSVEAIDRFHHQLNDPDRRAAQRQPGTTPRRATAAARRAHASAMNQLRSAGFNIPQAGGVVLHS